MARQLIGREAELDAVARLLDAPEQLPGTGVLVGEAGAGKTSIWLAAREAAAARGYRILAARPSEAETQFSFAGMTDLLEGVVVEVLPALPPVQRRALEAALLLGDSEIRANDRVAAAAFLGALTVLAQDGPLCLAVDDAQWLDAESLAALRFALARLRDAPVASLLAVRGELPPWIRRAVPEGRLQAIEVRGLSLGATRELLRARLDAGFSRPTLVRLWEVCGGNPFFALELATALQRRRDALAPGEELPVPTELDELLQGRLRQLSPAAAEVALVSALLATPTTDLVESAVGRDFGAGLAETLAAQVLQRDGERLRFSHPLLAAALVSSQTPAERRRLHARLARIAPTDEERARHLAISTAKPNSRIAFVVERASRSARARGAMAAAADLAERALRLTPANDPERRQRLLLAAETIHLAGDSARAISLLEHGRAAAEPGVERARILLQLGDQYFYRDPAAAGDLYRQALVEANGDHALRAAVHLSLSDLMGWVSGIEDGIEQAELALAAAELAGDPALWCRALAAKADGHFRAGKGSEVDMAEALAVERTLPEWPMVTGPTEFACLQLCWSFHLEEGRTLLLELLDARIAQDDAGSTSWALSVLALLEWRAGNWDEAERHAAASLELVLQLGNEPIFAEQFTTVILAAHRGRLDESLAISRLASADDEETGAVLERWGGAWLAGHCELSLGDSAAALPHLQLAYRLRTAVALEPAMRLELGDLLEAQIATGSLDEAEQVLDEWTPRAETVDRAWALAVLARGRGLLLAARGDQEAAFASFERALTEHARGPDPFHHARTLLALGKTQRRVKKRAAARATLEDAVRRFEELGAVLWAEQARAELARIGGRAPSRDELTEAEQRIAALVAEGRSNREVAAALFLTEHSVETALTRIYRKLGIRSRRELGRTQSKT